MNPYRETIALAPGAARTVRATADRRRRGARGSGAARTVRATANRRRGARGGGAKFGYLDIIWIIIRHRVGHQSGLDQSSRRNSAAILRRIGARLFLVFFKVDEKR